MTRASRIERLDYLKDQLRKRVVILDGAMGTNIQKFRLEEEDYRGERFADAARYPNDLKNNNDLLVLTRPEIILDIHRRFLDTGRADILETCTFGATSIGQHDYFWHRPEEGRRKDQEYFQEVVDAPELKALVRDLNMAASALARQACDEAEASDGRPRFVAGSIGPMPVTCSLSPDVNDPGFRAVNFRQLRQAYRDQVLALLEGGVDMLLVETIFDTLNAKAALFAIEEIFEEQPEAAVPVMVSVTLTDKAGRTLSGQTIEAFWNSIRHVRPFSVGINCALGPDLMRSFAEELSGLADCYVSIYANAGLPNPLSPTGYDLLPEDMARFMKEYASLGLLNIVGGCCGTTPAHMAALRTLIDNHTPSPRHRKPSMSVTSAQTVVDLPCDGHKIAVIGERINPTGKKRLQQALRDGDLDYVVSQGISQQEQGADILDVNVGLPEIDEVKIIQQATEQLQGSTLLPLQIDSTDPAAVEAAVRRYAGKPIINSVNGKQKIMDEIFPLVAHYGTNVVGLTLDEGGIPDTAEARFAIAERIVAEAARYGIGPDRILIDCLVMTASTNQRQAEQILRAMSLCKERLGVKCALGVSNISFGLPARPLLGSVFLAAAFGAGLDAPIMNPGSKRFMDTVYSYRVLSVEDEGSTGYIERYAGWTDPYKIAANPAAAQSASIDAAPTASTTASADDDPIRHMVVSGRKGEIAAETERLLADHDAMDLINNHFIPALDEVGVLFDQGKFFLPQLMASAEAARVGFDTIKRLMPAGEIADKGKICVATVKGDIHDIGKNIVKMLLDNYGYTVFDLGRDVDPQEVLKTVKERDIKLVGLSALMTTTVVAMEETIKLLHAEVPGVKIIVGGAVLTPEYAKQIGADYYAKDAAESARIAEEVFGQ